MEESGNCGQALGFEAALGWRQVPCRGWVALTGAALVFTPFPSALGLVYWH